MACLLVSTCPFISPKTQIKDVHTRRTNHCASLLNTSTCSTGINFLSPKLCGGEIMKRHHNSAVAVAVSVSTAVILDSKIVYTPWVIYGFWVGPENEDGWGFVEAIVNQMFDA